MTRTPQTKTTSASSADTSPMTVLARCGGITKYDRVEVQPWIEREGRYSFVTSDPLAVDLACFQHLA